MKMIISIVYKEDSDDLILELNKNNFFVTKLSTTGGFLRRKNVTLLIGVADEYVESVLSIIKSCCGERRQILYTDSRLTGSMSGGSDMSYPIEIDAGGATVFIVNVENFTKTNE